jgi:hypothetical protein
MTAFRLSPQAAKRDSRPTKSIGAVLGGIGVGPTELGSISAYPGTGVAGPVPQRHLLITARFAVAALAAGRSGRHAS